MKADDADTFKGTNKCVYELMIFDWQMSINLISLDQGNPLNLTLVIVSMLVC